MQDSKSTRVTSGSRAHSMLGEFTPFQVSPRRRETTSILSHPFTRSLFTSLIILVLGDAARLLYYNDC
jgi:hypothetical protein